MIFPAEAPVDLGPSDSPPSAAALSAMAAPETEARRCLRGWVSCLSQGWGLACITLLREDVRDGIVERSGGFGRIGTGERVHGTDWRTTLEIGTTIYFM